MHSVLLSHNQHDHESSSIANLVLNQLEHICGIKLSGWPLDGCFAINRANVSEPGHNNGLPRFCRKHSFSALDNLRIIFLHRLEQAVNYGELTHLTFRLRRQKCQGGPQKSLPLRVSRLGVQSDKLLLNLPETGDGSAVFPSWLVCKQDHGIYAHPFGREPNKRNVVPLARCRSFGVFSTSNGKPS